MKLSRILLLIATVVALTFTGCDQFSLIDLLDGPNIVPVFDFGNGASVTSRSIAVNTNDPDLLTTMIYAPLFSGFAEAADNTINDMEYSTTVRGTPQVFEVSWDGSTATYTGNGIEVVANENTGTLELTEGFLFDISGMVNGEVYRELSVSYTNLNFNNFHVKLENVLVHVNIPDAGAQYVMAMESQVYKDATKFAIIITKVAKIDDTTAVVEGTVPQEATLLAELATLSNGELSSDSGSGFTVTPDLYTVIVYTYGTGDLSITNEVSDFPATLL